MQQFLGTERLTDLDNMVFEANVLFLLSSAVLDIEHTYQIRRPTPNYAVENLEKDAREHAELGEGVRQR